MPLQLSFDATPPPKPGRLLFSITIPGRLPSWNDILGMEQWARYKFKGELARVFLSSLRLSEGDFSTRTTSAKSTMLIFADTLEHYLAMRQAERRSKSASKRLAAKSQKKPKSKSTSYKAEGEPPF